MAPTTISVNATETVSQTDNTDAASAKPIHNAAISQTFATGTSLFPAHLGGGTGTLPPRPQAQQELSAFRRFRGGSIPIMGKAPYSGGTEHVNTQSGLPMANSSAPAAVADPVEEALPRRRAIVFIVFLGVVSLFGDMTYEGARSITGPYLGMLGVTATTIGVVAGFVLNLFAVPLLALAGAWQIAVVLIIAERTGRGIRSPVRDAMLSHAASRTGLGWGFGLHQALDQLGAVAGPLVVSGVLFVGSGYQAAFGWLLIPAVLSMTVLLAARYLFPRPHDFELAPPALEGEGLAPIFWVYIIAVAFIAAGYADFSLIAYHFDKAHIMPATWIPILYAVAMAVDGLGALA